MAEAEAAPEEGGKKSKKKLIMMVVLIAVIGLLAAKMTVLKPPPLTPKQKADKITAAKYALDSLCAAANELPPPPAPKPAAGAPATTTTTTMAGGDMPVIGPVLEVDSKTLNLADGHFLKIGLGLNSLAPVLADDVAKDRELNDHRASGAEHLCRRGNGRHPADQGAGEAPPRHRQRGLHQERGQGHDRLLHRVRPSS